MFLIQEIDSNEQILSDTEQLNVEHVARNARNDITSVVSDLVYLASHPVLHEVLESSTPKPYHKLSRVFLSLCESSTLYDQIRYIDKTGVERARVNLGEGRPFIVADEELQDKSKRYYFTDIYELEPGKIYVSPMDLNIERGEIEQPLKPMIRFGTPVADCEGRKKGIILFNYLGSVLIRNLDTECMDSDGITMLLNSEGYWLKSSDPDDEWGFMYDDRKDRTLSQRDSTAWQEIQSQESGQFRNHEGIYTFTIVKPLSNSMLSSSGTNKAFKKSDFQFSGEDYHWKIVSLVPAHKLGQRVGATLFRWLPIYGIVILLLYFISRYLARVIVNRQLAQDGLEMRVREGTVQLKVSKEALIERYKELNCLYGISQIAAQPHISLEKILQGVVDLIPPGWQYPEVTCARIMLEDIQVTTKTFTETGWKQSTDITIRGKKAGMIDIFYLEEKPELDEGPFLKEERNLIKGIAEYLATITERKHLQELESRAERLATAGTIAGQVAHDFNNLLAPIMAYPEFISDELPQNHKARPYLEDIENAAKKIADINQDLLTLGRRGHYSLEVLDLNRVASNVVKEMDSQINTITYKMNLCKDLMNIKGGSAQLHRAISNLLVNARDALQDTGTIFVETENYYADDTLVAYIRIPKGEYVKLTISDTGCGIPDGIIQKILDPFFSTKTTDKERGSGLGLSVVDSVIKDHNGYLDVSSIVGQGTSFYLYFPVTREEADESESIRVIGGTESVLIIDDDEIQCDVSTRLLETLGYKVSVVESGEKAIEFLRENPQDLLILDMIMPSGIDGSETYRRILEFAPNQRAIIVSGFSESGRVSEAQKLGAGAFVKKPVTKSTIGAAVRTELDRQ